MKFRQLFPLDFYAADNTSQDSGFSTQIFFLYKRFLVANFFLDKSFLNTLYTNRFEKKYLPPSQELKLK